jgi:glucose-1-phosphate cytidylyltransferase
MKVVILCGGLGTRLREETEYRPKPMVSIGNKPILWHIMKIYAHYGLTEFILCLGYKGETIKEYFYHYELLNNDFTIELGSAKRVAVHQQHAEKGWRITLADTGEKALKGSRLKQIQKYVGDEEFMLTYGDGVANIDIPSLLQFHQAHGRLVTVTGVNPSSRFGELKVNGHQVERFREKPEHDCSWISGGFFVCNPQIFDYLSEDDQCDLEVGALEQIAQEGQLMMYPHTGFWACMDTLRDMEYLNTLWYEGNAGWRVW